MTSIPTLDARNLDPKGLFAAFREYGFVSLRGHAITHAQIERAYDAVRQFFALPSDVKLRYQQPGQGGARGYTPFRIERAKDQSEPDLKEFWHVGREGVASAAMPPNVWPPIEGFRSALLALYESLDALGAKVLAALASELELPSDWFTSRIDHGNSILRPLHYPPIEGGYSGVRSAAHEDINLITLMVAAGEPGLEILRRDGSWLAVETAPEEVIVNIGDMLQRLTNCTLPSTTHRVVNPPGAAGARSRYSLPYFLHLNPEAVITSLPSCVSRDRPDRYPTPITADEYLRERLREIGLLA
ncbi:MAG TPA: 2-oxoglutarate and iron-dependent oxygenase domain-containing protein [Polyangiales bacterium]|nr:2-oxoglutarate and iron-dependent oxygenase domain-containing protein [Polyangiales bacterium]